MPNNTITMQDVADAVGCSRSAVSLALRNDPRLPIATRQRIQHAARRLEYRPNPLISALMANLATVREKPFTAVIAYVSDFACEADFRSHRYHQAYFHGASQRAAAAGYQVQPFFFHEPKMTAAHLSKILQTRNVPGLLLAPLRGVYTPLSLKWDWFASVSIGAPPADVPLHTVDNHQFRSLHIGLHRLRALGYRRIGLVIHQSCDRHVDHAWTASFTSFQANLPVKDRGPLLRQTEVSSKSFAVWFQRHRPAIVVSHILQIRNWFQAMALNIPRDVGFFHIDLSPGNREVSGLNQNQALIGAAAADLVIEQLHHNERGLPAHPKLVLLKSEWVPGRTIRRHPS